MSRFRKKPVEIEARLYDGTPSGWVHIALWLRESNVRVGGNSDGRLFIRTLGGDMTASPGDWIIRGVQGEFYPCKPDVFEATHEPVPASGPGALEGLDSLEGSEA